MNPSPLTPLEKEFFKILSGNDYNPDEGDDFTQTVVITAKAVASLCERHKAEAWKEGYNDGSSDAQSYNAAIPDTQKILIPTKKKITHNRTEQKETRQ